MITESEAKQHRWQHFKGGMYKILLFCNDSDNSNRLMVVYESLATGIKWVRPFDVFFGLHESGVPRFTRQNL